MLRLNCHKQAQGKWGEYNDERSPEWVRTSEPVIRSPVHYLWTTAPAFNEHHTANRTWYSKTRLQGTPPMRGRPVIHFQSSLQHIKEPMMKGHPSCIDYLSWTLRCPWGQALLYPEKACKKLIKLQRSKNFVCYIWHLDQKKMTYRW